jgi:hypothetical protein
MRSGMINFIRPFLVFIKKLNGMQIHTIYIYITCIDLNEIYNDFFYKKKPDDDHQLELRRVDDHSVRVIMSMPAGQIVGRRRHLPPLYTRPSAPPPF